MDSDTTAEDIGVGNKRGFNLFKSKLFDSNGPGWGFCFKNQISKCKKYAVIVIKFIIIYPTVSSSHLGILSLERR